MLAKVFVTLDKPIISIALFCEGVVVCSVIERQPVRQ